MTVEVKDPPLREVSDEELRQVLTSHKEWLNKSDPKSDEGRADLKKVNLQGRDLHECVLSFAYLQGTNLQEANLLNAELIQADLTGADLRGAKLDYVRAHKADFHLAKLQGASLRNAVLNNASLKEAQLQSSKTDFTYAELMAVTLDNANLQGVKLNRAILNGSSVVGTIFRDADLQDADLSDTKGLLGGQLAGANVSGAKLPEAIAKFDGLAFVAEASKKAGKLFVSMILGCLYVWLTIATTKDVRLLTNSASTPLPIIQTEIPIAGFYWVAPIILLAFYTYFHLYLQRLWKGLADLPAIFPDGKLLDEKAYPWLLNGLVLTHVPRLRVNRSLASYLEAGISILFGWWIVPLTLFFLWGRYLTRHELIGTGLQIILLVISVVCGMWFQQLVKITLRGRSLPLAHFKGNWMRVEPYKKASKRLFKFMIVGGIVTLLAYIVSEGAINGIPNEQFENYLKEQAEAKSYSGLTLRRGIIPIILPYFGFHAFADLKEQDVSTKPANWFLREDKELVRIVTGAQLKDRDLRYASAANAFLVNADMRGAQLNEADLHNAQLRKADLSGASLHHANLQEVHLDEADLSKAQLQRANLHWAKLWRANLLSADLTNADLSDANLQEADLNRANLQNAKLTGAYLGGAELTGANLQNTNLFGAELQNANLQYAQLQKANLRSTKLLNAYLADAQLDEADLNFAQLQEANLSKAQLHKANLAGTNFQKAILFAAELQEANLRHAQLQNAELYGTFLQNAYLSGARLEGANLAHAIGLTQEQINLACVDEKTQLPLGIKRPKPCP